LEAGETPYEKDYLMQFEKIISRAEVGVAEGMEETRSLFQDAKAQLVDFFKISAENPFLARFLVEHRRLLKKVYGQKGLEKLFRQLFENGLSDAHRVAGQSYLDSEHYDLSSFHFSGALKLNPHDREIQTLLEFSLGMDAYYRNDYSRAVQRFLKWVSLRPGDRLKREYLKKAGEACHKMAKELEEEKRRKAARKAQSIAEQIRRML
jgi:tetratricopeptide (TPR) repeat protein